MSKKKEYEVGVTVTLEVSISCVVTASSEEGAEEKVEKLIEEGTFSIGHWVWQDSEKAFGVGVEINSEEQSIQVGEVTEL